MKPLLGDSADDGAPVLGGFGRVVAGGFSRAGGASGGATTATRAPRRVFSATSPSTVSRAPSTGGGVATIGRPAARQLAR